MTPQTTVTNQARFFFQKGDTATPRQFLDLCHDLMERDWIVEGKTYNLIKLGWKFKTGNTKRAIGRCKYSHNRSGEVWNKAIEMSQYFYRHNLTNGALHHMEDTMRHEIAHALDLEHHKNPPLDHGWGWKKMCRITGADPTLIKDSTIISHGKSKYTLSCNHCDFEVARHRMPKYQSSCPECSGGRYNAKYKLEITKNY